VEGVVDAVVNKVVITVEYGAQRYGVHDRVGVRIDGQLGHLSDLFGRCHA
jgi:hypothetical protein